MLRVTLPDQTVLEYDRRVRPLDIAADIGPRLAKATVAAEVNGQVVGADTILPADGTVSLRLLTAKDPESLGIMRHSCAHVMARAVMRLFEGVQLAFGPTVDNGFYYDFQLPRPLSQDDFPKIEAEMARIVQEDEPFERIEEPRDRAIELCRELGQQLKVEHLQEGLAEEQAVSFYRQGEFLDLCRGPHVPRSGGIGPFKLLSVAGAYWKGDASRQQLQRLYGTAWFSQKQLDDYLQQLQEAKRRDHRLLGKQLELFTIDPDVGSGLVLWLPKGAVVRRELESFLYGELMRRGYQAVYTPHIGRVDPVRGAQFVVAQQDLAGFPHGRRILGRRRHDRCAWVKLPRDDQRADRVPIGIAAAGDDFHGCNSIASRRGRQLSDMAGNFRSGEGRRERAAKRTKSRLMTRCFFACSRKTGNRDGRDGLKFNSERSILHFGWQVKHDKGKESDRQ